MSCGTARAAFAFSSVAMALALGLAAASCQTTATSGHLSSAANTQSQSTLYETLRSAITAKDGDVRKRAARGFLRRKQGTEASAALLTLLDKERKSLSTDELRGLAELYLLLPLPEPAKLFTRLVGDPRLDVRRTAWQLVASYPSPKMGTAIGNELSRRAESRSTSGFSPEAALAAKANGLQDAYPLLRAALTEQGHPTYVKAMTSLRPRLAAEDLLVYLSNGSASNVTKGRLSHDFRQCALLALAHFATYPPSLHHPNFKLLFHFAVAPDPALAAPALALLTSYREKDQVAYHLAQLPPDVQGAFLARLQRRDAALHDEFAAAVEAINRQ